MQDSNNRSTGFYPKDRKMEDNDYTNLHEYQSGYSTGQTIVAKRDGIVVGVTWFNMSTLGSYRDIHVWIEYSDRAISIHCWNREEYDRFKRITGITEIKKQST
jgi:hypothetical protein